MPVQVSRGTSGLKKTVDYYQKAQPVVIDNVTNENIREEFCPVKLDSIIRLKESTKKLLSLLEEIQTKTYIKPNIHNDTPNIVCDVDSTHLLRAISSHEVQLQRLTDAQVLAAPELKQLETQTKQLNDLRVEEEDDDCSIFKRLTRKCHCLNKQEYNDFIIHFNEGTNFATSSIGEVIKNLRILKKFLYMGGDYTKHALKFLVEGFQESSYTEKVDITQGCVHADICNVFEEKSIIVTCISWPCKMINYGDATTQSLAAGFVNLLAQIEEGRRYLKYTSKITNDLKKVIRKHGSKLDQDVLESLNCTLNFLHPKSTALTYYCSLTDEGFGNRTIQALLQYRHYMTLEEILSHLDLLNNYSTEEKGKTELTLGLRSLLYLFTQMLKEYDNSEINIIVTNIIKNIVSENLLKQNSPKMTNYVSTVTETIKMRNQDSQMPTKKHIKQRNKSKSYFGVSQNKIKQTRLKERSRVIVVPLEK